jgi:hypothetical protein
MKTVTLPKVLMPYHCEGLVRVGKDNDGGYLVNQEDITNSSHLLSFGIGEDISFESQFIQNNEWCSITAYDSTIGNEHDYFFVGRHQLKKENVGTNNIQRVLGDHRDVFLKCDIDGSEYEILYDLIENSDKFTGVAIEFHNLTNYNNFNDLTNFVSKFDLRLVHVHINNYAYIVMSDTNTFIPDVIELTFSSSKKNTSLRKKVYLPHVLDMPNNPNDDEFIISF